MHADKNRFAVLVGARNPLIQIHESVIIAYHDDFKIPVEVACDTLGSIEREILFPSTVGGADRAAVLAAMTGIYDYRLESLGPRAVSILVFP